ncbi:MULTISPECIES: 4,5-DOPA dioxygenase extradiol [Weeksella]|uniref:Extradiol ring-cleavage dioxygenase class III protein subunit B n=1 Tax=Weeksella virosa (strain ATCC 43766 / DSM 16922 / JCM 21250 / CCUG 30538 / CDC 9751 / IAM 14551 / NBRC 16016 / NCTC 11634 / CL345/78) TaxID=865938 RepID=F0P0W9_WEEVC|nr:MULTISPECIES: 4,5-DOPA dioxygenase extradiol [Weeksella]ADX67533.1 Extradiol ring-cleavage dioxygenase class III protein subunit B [Weeksella virosa DSM 16922]MDK7375299.1 4,5-DOPA dioxygenase extradiol [Weeksella virosa]MDK7676033.1 4,5-DOPA dioxygenase extradiol [Weeksella virosa]OFM84744.1 dioxygenase [Weeksella sp. HMSC059D05]SUP53828.1 LigB family dioxygenase [Weeksella virosa]
MNLKHLTNLTKNLPNTPTMPVLFMGHGNPMNAIEENSFVQEMRNIVKRIPPPKLILCISAHWETLGTKVTAMETPQTIHDFFGFPQALFEVQYPAPGSREWAIYIKDLLSGNSVSLDETWGLDHGAWSVIKHMYPEANIPVIELSLDYRKSPKEHYELARDLHSLRNKGVLVLGSGNNVHNLRAIDWRKINDNFAFDWALEANEKMKDFMLRHEHEKLINFSAQGTAFQLSIPTPEHYLPMLYTLSLQNENDQLSFFNDAPVGGSLFMTSVILEAS